MGLDEREQQLTDAGKQASGDEQGEDAPEDGGNKFTV